jgi:hypothetical protein
MGEQKVKNIAEPVQAYRVLLDPVAADKSPSVPTDTCTPGPIRPPRLASFLSPLASRRRGGSLAAGNAARRFDG